MQCCRVSARATAWLECRNWYIHDNIWIYVKPTACHLPPSRAATVLTTLANDHDLDDTIPMMNRSKSWRLLLYHGARVSEEPSWVLYRYYIAIFFYRWYTLVYYVYCHLVNLPHMFSTRIHQSRNARSNGQAVMLERTWKRAWHGSSLHRIEEIAQKGLKVGKKGSLGHWKLDLPKDSENGLVNAWWNDEGNGRRINWVERRCFGNCSVRWVQTGRFHLCLIWALFVRTVAVFGFFGVAFSTCCFMVAALFSCWLLHQWICLLPRFRAWAVAGMTCIMSWCSSLRFA